MFRFGDNNLQSSKQTSTAAKRSETGYVIEVILDDTNDSLPIFKTVGENASDVHTGKVGGVKVRLLSSQEANDDSLPIIYPLDDTIRTLPLLGEEVQIHSISGKKYYTRLLTEGFPNIQNSGIGEYQDSFGEGDTAKGSSTDYSSNQATGISQPQGGPSSNKGDYGDYFKADEKIHKLKLYEGDTILESRFGQSIRFSGYNNDDNTFSPTIIIRNRESDPSREAQGEFQSQKIGGLTEEDINRDGSTIAMGSRDKQFDFVPGVVDDKGNSDFETKPDTFKDYPTKLDGDQVLISSGRLIFSSKSSEMIFYSRGNYGFISDGYMSIDNKGGIDITTGDNINITTTDNDFSILAGQGRINLGDDSEEQLVRGNALVDLLSELLTELASETHPTPAGPSGPPVNAPKYNAIKNKLRDILSPNNYTN
tara:strand:- start:2047 stop:3315 length:1269 start_codon:yes stop_codon:yes gene_type:complete